MRALRYAIEEAAQSLWRGRQAGLLSTLTIALALFVLGAFLVVTANLDRLGSEWSRAAELSVYLKDEATPAERRAIEGTLASSGVVATSEYVSKSERANARMVRRSVSSVCTYGSSARSTTRAFGGLPRGRRLLPGLRLRRCFSL